MCAFFFQMNFMPAYFYPQFKAANTFICFKSVSLPLQLIRLKNVEKITDKLWLRDLLFYVEDILCLQLKLKLKISRHYKVIGMYLNQHMDLRKYQ